MYLYWTGVGSRETPDFTLRAMRTIAIRMEREGYVLRSGGAGGADRAFESGVELEENKEIYLPEPGFNGHTSVLCEVGADAIEMALAIHPMPSRLGKLGTLLHARNCYQVLGLDLKTPSEFLVCWTDKAEKKGGTRTAIVLAEMNNIPVLNLGLCPDEESCLTSFDRFHLLAA